MPGRSMVGYRLEREGLVWRLVRQRKKNLSKFFFVWGIVCVRCVRPLYACFIIVLIERGNFYFIIK